MINDMGQYGALVPWMSVPTPSDKPNNKALFHYYFLKGCQEKTRHIGTITNKCHCLHCVPPPYRLDLSQTLGNLMEPFICGSEYAWQRWRYPWLDGVNRDDLPTLVRRTASVCPVGVRPRVPRCVGERSGRPSWIPAHRPSCRQKGFDSQLWETLSLVCTLTLLTAPCPVCFGNKNNVTGDLLAHMCRSVWGPFRPFAIPDALCPWA